MSPSFRGDDPVTSRMAAAQIDRSGKKITHQKIIADFVASNPGRTAGEIGEGTGLGQHEASRRLPEIEFCKVQRGKIRRCEVKGTFMATWTPVDNFEVKNDI